MYNSSKLIKSHFSVMLFFCRLVITMENLYSVFHWERLFVEIKKNTSRNDINEIFFIWKVYHPIMFGMTSFKWSPRNPKWKSPAGSNLTISVASSRRLHEMTIHRNCSCRTSILACAAWHVASSCLNHMFGRSIFSISGQ